MKQLASLINLEGRPLSLPKWRRIRAVLCSFRRQVQQASVPPCQHPSFSTAVSWSSRQIVLSKRNLAEALLLGIVVESKATAGASNLQ